MAEIADVVPGQDVLATWGNEVKDRAVMRYTTLAALTTAEPTAPDGSLRWTDDEGLVIRQGGAWLRLVNATGDNPRFAGNVIVQPGASGQGYWIKPSDVDNTLDWRIIDSGGDLIIQSRASGSFQTQMALGPSGGVDFPGGVDRTADFTFNSESPVDSVTVSGSPYTVSNGSCSIPRAGLYRLTAAGFIEASSNVNTEWRYLAKTGGGTIVMETRQYVYGAVTTTVRANLCMGNLFRFSGSNTLQLSLERTSVQGTNILREYQIVAERVGD